MKYTTILLAAGSGSRMALGYNKMLLKIENNPLITLSLSKFNDDSNCTELIIVVNEKEQERIKILLQKHKLITKKIKIVKGSYERQYSVYNGLKHATNEIVLIHDGARPFITKTLINNLIEEAKNYGCSIPGVKVKDTIKKVANNFVKETISRENLYVIQTPQVCKLSLIKKVHNIALKDNYLANDEASLIEKYTNNQVKIVESSYDNIKITTKHDLKIASVLYNKYYK